MERGKIEGSLSLSLSLRRIRYDRALQDMKRQKRGDKKK